MKHHRHFVGCAAWLLLSAASAIAQAPTAPTAVTEFPADAQPLAAQVLQERVAGKVFNVKPAASAAWRLQFQSNGSYFINVGSGYTDNGKWRVEETRLCTEPQKTRASCNEMRLHGQTLYLKRDSGEIIKFEPN